MENKFLTLPALELLPFELPARNQSLYRLRQCASLQQINPKDIYNILKT
jgi:hypothetical protein